MVKKMTRVTVRINKKMKDIEDLKKYPGSELTVIKISYDNKAILELIQEKLETLYEDEIETLGLKKLTIDDAISSVLIMSMIEWNIDLTRLAENSRYQKVKNLREQAVAEMEDE